MAKSKFEYVKQFETEDKCLPNCWIVVRLDGKTFHRFTDVHHYVKPNDDRGLSLMTKAAQCIFEEYKDIVMAFGQSDEFSFVLRKNTNMFNRRESKLVTNIVSLFTSCFVFYWPRYFNKQPLQYPPCFDGRAVLYPSDQNLKDYMCWRQADCHINNLYNTCFWKLIQEKGLTPQQSQEKLKGTLSSDKNELLFQEFHLNYNNLPELYRKGTTLIRVKTPVNDKDKKLTTTEEHLLNNSFRSSVSFSNHMDQGANSPRIQVLHVDIIGQQFWTDHPEILAGK